MVRADALSSGVVPDPASRPVPVLEPGTVVLQDHGWKIIIFNDDVTPFDVVIHGLQRATGLSAEVAEMVAVEAHTKGSAVAKRGLTPEDAALACTKLRTLTRIEGLCPGVECTAEPDA